MAINMDVKANAAALVEQVRNVWIFETFALRRDGIGLSFA
jgi:hypothetical protein